MILLDKHLLLSELAALRSGVVHSDIASSEAIANIERLVSQAEDGVSRAVAERIARGVRCRCIRDYDMKLVKQCDPCLAIEEMGLLR